MLNGHREVANALIQAGARLSHESNLNLQYRMCQLAAAGDTRGFQTLLAGGVAVNAQGYDRRSALHLAACGGHLELVRLIIAHGGSVDCRDRWGRTPMADAIGEGHTDVQDALRLASWLAIAISDAECCSDSGSIGEILDSAGPSPPRSPARSRPVRRRAHRAATEPAPARPDSAILPDPDAHRFTAHSVRKVRRARARPPLVRTCESVDRRRTGASASGARGT
jgi:hypothetical protein